MSPLLQTWSGDRGCHSEAFLFSSKKVTEAPLPSHAHITCAVADDCGEAFWLRKRFVHLAVFKKKKKNLWFNKSWKCKPGCWKTWLFLMQLWKWFWQRPRRLLAQTLSGEKSLTHRFSRGISHNLQPCGTLKRQVKLEKYFKDGCSHLSTCLQAPPTLTHGKYITDLRKEPMRAGSMAQWVNKGAGYQYWMAWVQFLRSTW